jgi:hypothetical protein
VAELEAAPVPHVSSASVNRVPVPLLSLCDRLYVLWPPRVPSVSWYVEPDWVVFRVTEPEYSVLPVPVSMPWYWNSFLPVAASVMTCSWFGVPSSWRPPTIVS